MFISEVVAHRTDQIGESWHFPEAVACFLCHCSLKNLVGLDIYEVGLPKVDNISLFLLFIVLSIHKQD